MPCWPACRSKNPTPVSKLPPILPPPLPDEPVIASYPTRNNVLSPGFELRVEGHGDRLRIVTDGAADRVVRIAELVEVRLEFAPTRIEMNRYRCVLLERNGRRTEFFNRRFTGFATFEPTDETYVVFVRVLLLAIERYAPDCRCCAGAGGATYALGAVGFVTAALALLMVAGFVILNGLWWLVVVKALLMLFYFPTAWRWLKRNRERTFVPSMIPAAVLPGDC